MLEAACLCAASPASSAFVSLLLSVCSFLIFRQLSRALVYRAESKISSNFFFSTAPSCSGHELSSWWQKMTFSKMGADTPKRMGTVLDTSVHECGVLIIFPSSPLDRITPSSCLNWSLTWGRGA